MRIEIRVPVDTDPSEFDTVLSHAAPMGYVLQRRSGMPVDFTATIVVETGNRKNRVGDLVPADTYLALSAELYKLKEGETP